MRRPVIERHRAKIPARGLQEVTFVNRAHALPVLPWRKGNVMTARKNETVTYTPAIVRAFAEYLEAGNVSSLEEFANSEAGQTAAAALADQKNAELRSLRMSWARAVARDFKFNGKLTTYSKDRAISLRDFLATVNFDEVPEPESATADEPETATADAE
jgi:hypothetical protein